ncbi:MAG: hypothetical protein ABH885_04905 [Candidatus Omnitrophota bacterium]
MKMSASGKSGSRGEVRFAMLCVALILMSSVSFSLLAFGEVLPAETSKYVSRLEKKQESLVFMKENLGSIQAGMKERVSCSAVKAADATETGKAVVKSKVMEVTPNTSKLILSTVPLQGPITPRYDLNKVKEELEGKYRESKAD